MPFLRNEGETMEEAIEIIVTIVVTAIKITLYVMAIIAPAKCITA